MANLLNHLGAFCLKYLCQLFEQIAVPFKPFENAYEIDHICRSAL